LDLLNLEEIISICVMEAIHSTLPSNNEYSIPQVKMLLKEIEQGISKEISLDDWDGL